MVATYRPIPGQVVMVEPLAGEGDPADQCMTGVVMGSSDCGVTIDLGHPGSELEAGDKVVVRVFSAEAMFKLHGAVQPVRNGRVVLDPITEIERVQRRRSTRRPMRLSVTLLCDRDDDPTVSRLAGRSIDVGAGGLRVETVRPLPRDSSPLAILSVPEGAPLMLPTRVVSAAAHGERCEYRLAFTRLRPSDADRLAVLLASPGRR